MTDLLALARRGPARMGAASMKKGWVRSVHPCDKNHQVVNVITPPGGAFRHRPEVCAECPWRRDRPRKVFPAEAFRHSARTCHDMAESTFACHMSGVDNPATCAGFLLSADAQHNLMIRIALLNSRFAWSRVRKTTETFGSYRKMAIANRVDRNDPALARCRGN